MADPPIRDPDQSSLRKVFSGGAPVSAATVNRFEELTGVYIHNAYGLTETTAPSILTPLGSRAPVDPTSGALSVGLPVQGVDVTVVDKDTRHPVPPGDVGELVIAGPMVVPGYWEKPEESRHAMPGGRLHTGDIGFMDADGWVFVVDRAKDQINASGYKVWPREVEDVLYQHPKVKEAAVIGRPDEYRGETVAAYIVATGGEPPAAEELDRFCRERLSAYKCPRSFDLLPELPKTLSGKVLRRELREREQ
jgi:long-chain acyl-CoA synthetase